MIVLIYKKRDKNKATNYREITLRTGYKIYAINLQERLEREVEEKRILPETQAGFRKERNTMDNIYILNYAIGKDILRPGGKVHAFFADLKAAFDIVDRKKLWSTMKGKGISNYLVNRIEEIYEETINACK